MARTVVIVCFLVAFAAGLAVGIQSHRSAGPPAVRPGHHSGWLVAELNLTAPQQEELKKIWSDTASQGGHERDDRHRQLTRERDEAIAALVRPEDKPKYDGILKNYADQKAALDREWRGSFDAAVERTKQILTPEQRTKYEALLQKHQAERGAHEHHWGEREGERRGEHRAASRASSQP